MSERRRLKKKGQDVPVRMETQPTKIEYAVAKYLKNNVPTKKTKFLNHQVSYFNANKAIDVLLDSPWATGENALFTDRVSVVEFGNKLLQDKFFHRAKKIAVTDKDLSPKELKKKQEKLKEKEKEKKKESSKKKDESEDSKKEDEKSNDAEKKDKQKKKKTKIKLDMHLEQVFVDGSEAYVWMYDPIPFWYYIVGTFLLLFAAVAICLFPLWPPSVRKGVYYLSIGAAGFLGVILGLAVLRFIIFMIIWVLSLGRHHFWILPNLTEDVGFFASFWSLYHVFWYYIVGTFLLFAAVAICLFPLWPPSVRKGVYYLSIGAAGFLGVILGLAVLRFIIFMIIWVLSLGRHHFWILPNLTEDVGFFASFWSLYHVFWYYIVGTFLLFAAVAICLFPLWPPSVRKGVYYLSIGAAVFLGVILGLAVLRFIIFMIIWVLSLGRHHFWILINLTEVQDVRETVSEETDSENSNSQTFEIVDKSELTSADDAKGEEEEGEGEEEEEEEEEEESEKKD